MRERCSDPTEGHARATQRTSTGDRALLMLDLDERGPIFGQRVAVWATSSGLASLRSEMLQGCAGALAKGLALPFGNRREKPQHEPPSCTARIDRFTDRDQAGLALGKVALDQRAQIAHGASEAI